MKEGLAPRGDIENVLIGHALTYPKSHELFRKYGIMKYQYFTSLERSLVFSGILKAWEFKKVPTALNIQKYIKYAMKSGVEFQGAVYYQEKFDDLFPYYASQISFYLTCSPSYRYSIDNYMMTLVEYIIYDYWYHNYDLISKNPSIHDIFEYSDSVISGYRELVENHVPDAYKDDGDNVLESEIKKRKEQQEGNVISVQNFLPCVNERTGGFVNSEFTLFAGRPGMGKCLGKGTKVLMYDGSIKKVEDVKVGDQLMGDDSTPRNVLSLSRGREEMYWIRQNNGIDYRVNKSHILSLKKSRSKGSLNKGDVLNISVEDYLTKSNKFKSNFKGYKVDVEFDEKPLEIDPYYIGLWLGDGTNASSAITTEDPEVIDYIESYANKLDLKFAPCYPSIGTPRYSINGVGKNFQQNCFIKKLRDMNLLNNKHIPKDYLINSKKNRLRLLAGLIDSDGHYQEKYDNFEIVQKDKELSEQIFFLCNSLGFKTSFRKKIATLKSRDYSCEVYRIRISGNLDTIPTLVKRKQARKRKSNIDWRVGGIKVEYDKIDDYYGFEIDGNKLFLLEDMTVTHNTTIAIIQAMHTAIENRMPVLFFTLEMPLIKIYNKIVSWRESIPYKLLRDRTYSDEQAKRIYRWYKYLESDDSLLKFKRVYTLEGIVEMTRQLKPKLVIIDYLQLMTTKEKIVSREQQISYISRSLKLLSNELDIPLIALSQLNRNVESRVNKRPVLSDLRESGSLEQDADNVVMFYRDSYYKEMAKMYFAEHERWNVEWIEAKNRMSGTFNEEVNINFVTGDFHCGYKNF